MISFKDALLLVVVWLGLTVFGWSPEMWIEKMITPSESALFSILTDINFAKFILGLVVANVFDLSLVNNKKTQTYHLSIRRKVGLLVWVWLFPIFLVMVMYHSSFEHELTDFKNLFCLSIILASFFWLIATRLYIYRNISIR